MPVRVPANLAHEPFAGRTAMLAAHAACRWNGNAVSFGLAEKGLWFSFLVSAEPSVLVHRLGDAQLTSDMLWHMSVAE